MASGKATATLSTKQLAMRVMEQLLRVSWGYGWEWPGGMGGDWESKARVLIQSGFPTPRCEPLNLVPIRVAQAAQPTRIIIIGGFHPGRVPPVNTAIIF